MNLSKFEGKKLTPEKLHPISGGARLDTTNCGTAETSSQGWDTDTDSGTASDTDKEIEKEK